MKELVGDERCRRWHPAARRDIADEGCGDQAEDLDHAVETRLRGQHLVEKDEQIEHDKRPGDNGLDRLRERIVVVDRYDHEMLSSLTPSGPDPAATTRRPRPCRWRRGRRRTENRRDD